MPALYNGMSGREAKPFVRDKRLKIQRVAQICPRHHRVNRVAIHFNSRQRIDVILARPVKALTASFVSESEITES
jgi:hypothetical protein